MTIRIMLVIWRSAALLLFILRIWTVRGDDCPSGWDTYGDKCYKFVAKSLTVRGQNWENARANCQGYGGDLVSIGNRSEQTFITQKTRQYRNLHFWIGFNDRRNESNFEWSDGSAVTYKSWGRGEPNNFKNEDCTEMYYFSSTWNDNDCGKEYSYICKRNKGPLPVLPTLTPPTTITPLNCDIGWVYYGTSCYKFNQIRTSWPSAKKACRQSGGYLLKIDDADEQHYMTWTLMRRPYRYWIGLNDLAIEGTYAWEDGTPVNYTHWQTGEPNDSHGDEDCIEVYTGALAGYWNDDHCDSEKYYICEKPNGQNLCPANWDTNGDYCYRFNAHPAQRVPWQNARSACKAFRGADLASILSEDEHTYVLGRLNDITNVGRTWIGFNDIVKEGAFVWSDRSPVQYTNWDRFSPDLIGWFAKWHDCTVIQPSTQGGNWTTDYCSSRRAYVCKRKRGLDQCDSPLGMIDGNIGASQVTASSFKSTFSRPSQARLQLKASNDSVGAWCAQNNRQGEYLQIDLGLKRKITHMALQGRSSSSDFVRTFYLQYGDNGQDFLVYGQNKTQKYKVFRGSSFSSDQVVNIQLMKGAINARFVRIYPLTWNTNICLRTEIYGCEFEAADSQNCGADWEKVNNTCYQINIETKIWADARATCNNRGGDLLSITSVAEKQYIANRLKPLASSLYTLWIGLNDRDANRRYFWSDFSPFVFTNWYRGNPTDRKDQKACVAIMADTGAWKDESCGQYKPFICKRKLGNRAKVPITGNWISGTDYYWPLNTLRNGVALGTMPASVTGNVTVTDIMELGRDVVVFASYNAYLNAGQGQGCIVDGKECRNGFSVSLVVKFKKEASTWGSNTFIVDSVGDDSLTTHRGFSVYVNNNKLYVFFATDTRQWSANTPLRTDVWLHVAFTWSPGAGIVLYINGVQQKQQHIGQYASRGDNNQIVTIGSKSTAQSAGGFYMRSLAVWERDLASREVNGIYLAEFGSCTTGWKDYGQHCYLFSRQSMSWPLAELACQGKGANLITINSPVEQAHITVETGKYGLNNWAWIGMHDRIVESAFEWSDGSPVMFTNWNYWQPDNWWNREDCVHTINYAEGRWNDISCHYNMNYICRKPKVYVPNGNPSPIPKRNILCEYAANQLSCPASTVMSITSANWGRTAIDVCGRISVTNCKFDATQKVKDLCENQAFCTINPTNQLFGKDPCKYIRKYLEVNYVCKPGRATIPGCPGGWSVSPDGSRCLTIFFEKKTWREAKDTCRSYGAELTSLHSGLDNSFMTSLMVNSWDAGDIWIGLNDLMPRGTYKWTDNTTVDYSSWYTHEPHDHTASGSCVKATLRQRSMGGKMYWLDSDCSEKLAYACKKYKANYTPAPPVTTKLPTGHCPQGWTFSKSACFIVNFTRKSWLEARDACRALGRGADLASIRSREENNFVKSALLNQTFTVWIGLNDRGLLFGHIWSDSSALKFTSWGPQQPNSLNGQQPCVEMASTGDWNDIGCFTPKPYLCRLPRPNSAPTTLPTTPAGPITTQDPKICGLGWVLWNTKCYHFGNETSSNIRTWMDARAVCRQGGGDLVSIHSQAEQDFIWNTFKIRNQWWAVWIGIHDLGSESSYEWSDGTAVDYTFYNVGEPNDWQGQEDCMELYRGNGKWNDNHCANKKPFICKKFNNSYVPPPTTIPPSPGPTRGRCDKGWVNYDKSCYRIAAYEQISWDNARSVCQKGVNSTSKGELVTINNMYENAFLLTVLKDYGEQTFWIGLNDKHTENRFSWTDAAPTTYINWNTREPANSQYKDCVEITSYQQAAGRWNLIPCSARRRYICESPLLPVTATTPPVTGPTPTPNCTAGYTQYGTSCYMMKFIAPLSFTWREANEECTAKYGGDLVSIHDPFEQALIESKLLNYGGSLWIGMSRQANQGSFQWTDNSLMEYTHWAAQKPSVPPGNSACVQVGTDGRWVDKNCSSTAQAFMCKIHKGDPHVSPTYVGTCPKGWVKFDKHCYQFNENYRFSWSMARVRCTQQGGDLLSLNSVQEKDFIVYQYKQKHPSYIWIGLNDRAYERGYEWSDGSPLTYVNWRTYEPNDHSGRENCVEMDTRQAKWNDLSCSAYRGFICKSKLGCSAPLGMVAGNITDDQLSASSTLDSTHGPSKARLNSHDAWCASSTKGDQYLQVDFLSRTRITKIATQGHSHNGAKFVKTYKVLYSDDGQTWQTYHQRGVDKVFQGNTNNNPNAVVTSSLWIPGRGRPVHTRYLKIQPLTWQNKICLRVEFYGCTSDCQTPLLRTRRISTRIFSASSSRSQSNNAGQAHPRGDGWCAKTADSNQWFQISFNLETKISRLLTFGGGNSYVTVYQLSYSDDGVGWASYTERGKVRNFRGNTNLKSRISHQLVEPIATKFLRVRPMSWGKPGICLRLELFGCLNSCDDPLGLSSGTIEPRQLSASSVKDEGHSADMGRLNGASGWNPATSDTEQYLQVDIGTIMRVRKFGTQGSADSSMFVKSYTVSFSVNNRYWRSYMEAGKVKTFTANTDAKTVVTNQVSWRIRTRYVRINPKSWSDNGIGIRLELYGCPPYNQPTGLPPTATPTATGPPEFVVYTGSLKVTSVNWTDAYNDKNSAAYKGLASKIQGSIGDLYVGKDAASAAFVSADVTGFRKGSVIVSFNMTFIRDIATTTDVKANLVNGVKKDKLGDLSVDHNSLQLKVQSGGGNTDAVIGTRTGGLSGGAKAGIAITVLLLVGAGLGVGFWYFWRNKKGTLQFSHKSFDNPIHFSSKAYDMDG